MDELISNSNQERPNPVLGRENNGCLDIKTFNPLDITDISLHPSLLPTIETVQDWSKIAPETLSWDHLFGWKPAITEILQQDIYPTLQQFAQSPDFQSQIHFIFGDNLDAGNLKEITSQWLVGNFQTLPQIEVLNSTVFPTNTLGAFAGETNKIYLSEKLLKSGNTELIKETVLEEVGHSLDKQINIVDTPGDEGQLFAAVITGKQLNAEQIAEIKTEDDTTKIFADGQLLTVEQATLSTITISANDANAAETVTGQTANPGKFTIKRTGDLTSNLAVNYTVGGSATNGTDYNQLTGNATFAAGSSTAIIDLKVINDAVLEAQETVIVTLSSSVNYLLGTAQTATVNIADNDKPTITIKASDATAAETVTGQTTNPGKFTLTRTGDLSSSPTVNYTVTGTATNGTDYNQLNGSATFASGSSTAIIDLTVINDPILEAKETVIVTLASSANYTLGTAQTATVNIVDNDKPTVTIKASDATAAETLTGQTANPGRFTITRTGDLSSSPTVNYTVAGTATNGTDYQTLTKNVTFAAGSATAIIDVTPIDDAVYEGNETVIVTLAGNANYTVGTAKTATVNIVDNDKPTVTIKASDVNAAETVAGQTANPGKFTLTRTGNKTAALTVNYTVVGTATNGTDYNTLTKNVTFAAGSATAIIDVIPIDDFGYEGNETVIVTLANKATYLVGTANTATVNLLENDSATTIIPTITISASDSNAGETVSGETKNPGQFKLTRTGDLSSSLTVNYSIGGTAINGTDYNTLTKTVSFAAGSATALINISPIDDVAVEGDETVVVTLSSNANYNLGTAKGATVKLVDNDPVTYITVGSPNGGDALLLDGSYNITWNDNISENVKIDLYQNGIFHSNIFSSTPSDGSEIWTISDILLSESNYQIKVSSVNNANLFDFSDSNFRIGRNWVQRIASQQDDSLVAIDTDSNNNIYITGTSNSFSAGLLIKQDSVMNTTWFQTGLSRNSTGLAVDKNRNVYVSSPDFSFENGVINKYDTNASLVWNRQLDSGYQDIVYSADTDSNNNIYISGFTNGSFNGTNAGYRDAFIAKYNSTGTLLWTRQLGTNGDDYARKITTDSNGNAYVYGTTTGNLVGNNLGGSDFFLAKYNSSGNLLWKRQFGTNLDDEANSLATDNNGNIYIYGNVGTNIGGSISTDVFLAKYSSSGNSLWTKQVGTTFADEAGGIRTDNNGNVYIAGSTSGNIAGDNQGAKDVFVIKYDTLGNLLWSEQFGSSGDDVSRDIAVDNNQRIYVVGDTTGSLNPALTNVGGTDGFIKKLSPISQGLIPITVTSPNGGNTLQMGSNYNITWSDSISENVKIDLYKGDVFNRTLFTSTVSDGSESWTLPTTMISGNDYRIKVSSVDNPDFFDFGNGNFTINSAPFITVTSPNGGNTFQAGSSYNITWSDNFSENVKIDLFKGGVFNSTLFSSTLSDGSETWTVPTNLVDGNNYSIKIGSVNNSNLYDLGDANFTVKSLPTITIAANDSDAEEVVNGQTQNPGKFTFTRTGSTANSLTVNYTVSGTATNGTDYSSLSGTATFSAGSATTMVTVTPIDDTAFEGNETVILTLTAGTGYALGSAVNGTVTITDNDLPTIFIANNDANAGETISGQTADIGQFVLARTEDISNSLTVYYTISGTATNGVDYTSLSGNVIFAANSPNAIITLNPLDDAIYEGDETVTLTLSSKNNYTIGTLNTSTISIADNEISPSAPLVTIATSDTVAAETQSGETPNPGLVTIARSGSTTNPLTVYYTVSGTATNGIDYSYLNGSIFIPAGFSSIQIPINVIDDRIYESFSENIILTLSSNSAYQLGTAYEQSSTVYISDDNFDFTLDFLHVSSNDPGNNLNTALDLEEILSSGSSYYNYNAYRHYVGSDDADDYYILNLKKPAEIKLKLFTIWEGSINNVELKLIDDRNKNLVIDTDDILQTVTGSQADYPGIEQSLAPGIYYVQVHRISGDTLYSLSVSANVAPTITITGNQTQSGSLSNSDDINPTKSGSYKDDYYLTDVFVGQQLQIDLSSSAYDSYLQLINYSTGAVITEDDDSGGNRNSRLTFTVQDGIQYIVRATSYGSAQTGSYLLKVQPPVIAPPLPPPPADYAGNSLSSSRNIGTYSTTYTDWVGTEDTDDYYHFTVSGARRNVVLRLTGLSNDADLELLDGSGNVYNFGGQATSNNGGNTPEYITRILEGGDYYIHVKQFRGNTNYTLEYNPVALSGQVQLNGASRTVELLRYDDNGKSWGLEGINPNNAHVDKGLGIESNKNTIVVIHGWNNNDTTDGIGRLARFVSTLDSSNTQVLAVNWGDIAQAGLDTITPYNTANWISSVALWVTNTLESLGINPSKLSLFGHSLGTYVSYEIGRIFKDVKGLGKVENLVALDPAYPGNNYDINGNQSGGQIGDFKSVANNSIAFVVSDFPIYVTGNFIIDGLQVTQVIRGIAGDNSKASTANKSFIIDFPISEVNPTDLHGAVVDVFTYALKTRKLTLPNLSGLPDLKENWYDNNGDVDNFIDRAIANYGQHEGTIYAKRDNNGDFWAIDKLVYIPPSGNSLLDEKETWT
ncbi:Calx-beta domain-containing protein [Anabaena cylindrica UHCC 0172]|uniref:Calx-beta domain-containing protein n=1 Tax=Anabaena cylindrica TaxID=1165 RepID=UPI002B21109A|nr:Calx-beta domain-containing protein [Anabaena cylindrica]MEA5549740.1 Calx-beta domain-containing protein [Anabaena cylindrica UHCC 0172]